MMPTRDTGHRVVLDPGFFPGSNDRFKRQVEFLLEIDRLKHTFRQTLLLDRSRHENTVEHSWHIAVSAMLFAEHAAGDGIDLGRVIRMLLLHDIVEIDAGDTYCYDERGKLDQHARESRAADRLFGILAEPQSAEFRALWDEFEAAETGEARYAHAMDRFQAFLHNYATEGQMWRPRHPPRPGGGADAAGRARGAAALGLRSCADRRRRDPGLPVAVTWSGIRVPGSTVHG
jgi:putative hydrolase of HD superfamily